MPPATLTIPSATRYLTSVREFVTERAEAAGLNDLAIDAVRLATDEACANAIEHAYSGREDGTVTVETRREPGRFLVVIRHTGLPFDASRYRPISLEQAVREGRRGGFGVRLMNQLVDRVEYRKRGRVSEVHLIKQLNGDSCASSGEQ
jgi:serine/threonine-protein kinase RsbW